MDLLGLPRARRRSASPCPASAPPTRTYAQRRARSSRALGATLREIDIRDAGAAIVRAPSATTRRVEDLTFENVQAWTRKMLLFAAASQERGIDLGTGDLSELALGLATYGGDHMSHYGVNAGVPKTLIPI